MDIEKTKTKLVNALEEVKGLVTYAEKIAEKQDSTEKQYAILLQKENAVATKNKQISKDLEAIETERKRVLTQRNQLERGFELLDKQKADYSLKMGEMRIFQAKIDKKIEKAKEIDTRELEVSQQEIELAERSKKVAHREGLVAKDKEILRERKQQLDLLEEKRKAKLDKLNRMLGE